MYSNDLFGKVAVDWSELSTIGVVVSIRQESDKPSKNTDKVFISSAKLSARALLESTHSPWNIENQMHWRLDVGFNEDACRIGREQARQNFAVVRHMALNLLTA
ncbi:ISAs1 family transposase [Vibrio splendidus]|uniref:ISAs1 family transposase n=1 Tax=Vibrio splendidus TaxID=29497 RepID=UPI00076A9B23|nr:ISAs1 family transposase [Vibrio splendidus]